MYRGGAPGKRVGGAERFILGGGFMLVNGLTKKSLMADRSAKISAACQGQEK